MFGSKAMEDLRRELRQTQRDWAAGFDERFILLEKMLGEKTDKHGFALEESVNKWLSDMTVKQREEIERSEQLREAGYKHMENVENCLLQQKEILVEIKNSLKVLALGKARGE